MRVKLRIYDGVKYDSRSKKVADVEYDIFGYEVATGVEAEQIGSQTDESSRDPYNEYLVLNTRNGGTATFRNSFVDLFTA